MLELTQKSLRETEGLCTQEQQPYCMAACPMHVDGRALCKAVAAGDFAKGREILEKSIPFPRIIASLCEAPCSTSCRRQEIGDGLQLQLLEQACMTYGAEPKAKRLFLPKKSQQVAIIGGGLSGLNAAAELARKGYRVTVMEAREQIGGRIWQFGDRLSAAQIEQDFALLDKLNITVQTGCLVDQTDLQKLLADYDSVYVSAAAVESIGKDYFQIDLATLTAGQEGLFAGGEERSLHSPVFQLADGKRAAISIDRYMQKASLTQSRENEGTFQSTLFTVLDGITPEARVNCVAAGGYSQEEAIAESKRCIDCQCLECVKGCAFLRHYKKYPRTYVREVFNNMSIVMGIHSSNGLINSCSLCGQCKVICPNHLDMGEICRIARNDMVTKGKMPPSAHDFALLDMSFSNGDDYFLSHHQPGYDSSSYVLFPGCQMGASLPEVVKKVYGDLCQRLEGGVGLMLGCCGAIADWAGDHPLLGQELEKIVQAWQELGRPQVITLCPSCQKTFAEYTEIVPISIVTLLQQLGLPAAVPQGQGILAVHDSCGTRFQRELQDSVRSLAGQCGYRIEELPYSRELAHCCGYGGLVSVANKAVAQEMVQQCVTQSDHDYLTYCVNCRDHFMNQGKKTRHLLELVYGLEEHKVADISQRRINRIRLKKELLINLWGEEMAEREQLVACQIDEAVQQKLNERMILLSDIQQVLLHGQESQETIYDQVRKIYICSHRIGNVTFWVEFVMDGDRYIVRNAYSHRMSFEEGENNGAIL